MPGTRPTIRLKPREERRILSGHPWVYANEIVLDAAARALEPGAIVALESANGKPIGCASFNLHSLIAARLYDPAPDCQLDADYFAGRLRRALQLREQFFDGQNYRMLHAEGDGLPGFIVDRYGSTLVMQANTAGAERLSAAMVQALETVLSPERILLRNDSRAREREGLAREVRWVRGGPGEPVEIIEGGLHFMVDLEHGQKTGWFFDLAPARALLAARARRRPTAGENVLDLYCHTGAFGLQMLGPRADCGGADCGGADNLENDRPGAQELLGIDSSEAAMALARQSAERNGLGSQARFLHGEAFAELAKLGDSGRRFGLVIADPPSFVKARKELKSGARGYRKLARLLCPVVEPGGLLFLACCSHHVDPVLFGQEIAAGLGAGGREARILATGGAGPDHPVHPHLPESAYLKYQLLQLD